nr:hypothetical protein CFP56_46973 [Quercus suber]
MGCKVKRMINPLPIMSLMKEYTGITAYIKEHSDATAYKYRGSHISDVCLVYGNESQNGRSSCLDMKMEVNNNALWMGLTVTWDMQYPAGELEISYQGKIGSLQLLKPQHVLKNFRDHQGRDTRST